MDSIYHFASPASPVDYLELPLETLLVGSAGTHNTLEVAKAKGARFLMASTSEVYGDPAIHPQPEEYWGNVNPNGTRAVYDEAKRYAEAVTFAYRRLFGMDAKIVRIFNTFGPRMRINDGRVVPAFISQALRGEDLTVFGDGTQTRSFCYVSDLIDGIYRLSISDQSGPINVGNPSVGTDHDALRRGDHPDHGQPEARSLMCRCRPPTTPSSGGPTSPRRGRCWAGSRACRWPTACGRPSPTSETKVAKTHAVLPWASSGELPTIISGKCRSITAEERHPECSNNRNKRSVRRRPSASRRTRFRPI